MYMATNSAMELIIVFYAVLALFVLSNAQLSKRFEYKHSFKGPHLVQKDRTVPFWTYVGNAIASDDFVRLAPSLKSQRGLMWNKIPAQFDNWEVEVAFKVSGRGRVGADGLAFWYTKFDDALTGPVFGSRDQWNGLAVFFDSFDNDAENNNPYISAQINDGTKKFDHMTDGSHQQLGGCMRDYRNKPYPVRARIRYENKVLTVDLHQGLTQTASEDSFEPCFRAESIDLSSGGHFSVSAATGGLADDHDVLSLLTCSLRTEEEMKSKQKVEDEERQKYEKEFEEYDKKLEEAKTEYQKENPDAVARTEPEASEGFFDGAVEELRMIFDGQQNIHKSISNINKRITELISASERVTAQLSVLQQQKPNQVANQGSPPVAASTGAPAIQRHEVDQLIRASSDLLQGLNTLRATVDSISREKRSADGGGGGAPFADKTQHQVADGVNEIKQVVQRLYAETQHAKNNRQPNSGQAADCPNVNCVSTLYFGGFILAQMSVFLIYSIYVSRKEAAAKKFY